MRHDILRTVILTPYAKGMGPRFTLQMRDGGERRNGQTLIAYTLWMKAPGMARTVIFEGADYGVGAFVCIDSDDAVRGLLGFLTLRPGDTDADYFTNYTKEQRAFCDTHAEALAMATYDRFGEG
jgi:hypothetical protein